MGFPKSMFWRHFKDNSIDFQIYFIDKDMILFFERISPKSITKKMTHWNKKKLNWSKKDVVINDLLSNVLIFILLCKNT